MKAQQLKNAILQLAIQGKLVPQDPNDEPASELLCKIKAEKDRLIAEGKIKKSKKSADKAPYTIEPPFEIPESWVWVRLVDITHILGDGIHGTPQYDSTGEYFFVNGNNLNNETIEIKANTKKVNFEEYLKYRKELNDRTILVSINGTLGNTAYFNNEKIILGKSACYFNLSIYIFKPYIKYLINTFYYLEYANKFSTGSTIKNLSLQAMRDFLVPLPPLNEQHRIVQKIEELLPLVERYDQTEQKLTKLNDTFPEQLKKSVLQTAIQGKLTEQLATDEPASELLKRIESEKMRLISEGKLKKPKLRDNSQNAKFEPPFEIPTGWEWVRLDNYAYNFDGKRKPVSVEHRSKQKKIYDYYGATGAIDKVEDYIFNGKYILIGEDGGNFFVNRDVAFIVNGKFWANNHVHVLGTSSGLEEYLCLYLNALNLPAMGLINGIAVPKLNQQNLNSIFIAVPPLEEQKRIVEKVELLLSQIERL